jgi:glycosyltransferase involved in cell wall biosynthesis
VAPLAIARGTQNKILEAMAMGVPVVTSTIAAGGVDAVPGEHLLVADTPQQVAAAVLRLVGDAAERARFAAAGRARVLSHHDWNQSMVRLDAIIGRCVQSAPAWSARRPSAA